MISLYMMMMDINNSEKLLQSFIETFKFETVAAEYNFPVKVASNVSYNNHEALNYLVGSAMTGNKAVGLFHNIPPITLDKPLRGALLLIGIELPDFITVPTIFCRDQNDITFALSNGLKLSMTVNMPVQVIIAPNALNNFTMDHMPYNELDRVSPYIHPKTFENKWQQQTKESKLAEAWTFLSSIRAPKKASSHLVFDDFNSEYPFYMVPLNIKEQREMYADNNKINTSLKDASILNQIVNTISRVDIPIEADRTCPTKIAKPFLCPGCPFAVIAPKAEPGSILLSSIKCDAIKEIYNVQFETLAGYEGMLSNGINVKTYFISNASDFRGKQPKNMTNSCYIVLNNDNSKPFYSSYSNPAKIKVLKNLSFPYSCNNIKKYSQLKFKEKKCVCVSNGTGQLCVQNAHCPAIYATNDKISIDTKQCTGCRTCVSYCKSGAIK